MSLAAVINYVIKCPLSLDLGCEKDYKLNFYDSNHHLELNFDYWLWLPDPPSERRIPIAIVDPSVPVFRIISLNLLPLNPSPVVIYCPFGWLWTAISSFIDNVVSCSDIN